MKLAYVTLALVGTALLLMKKIVFVPAILSGAWRCLPTPCDRRPSSLDRPCVHLGPSLPALRESIDSLAPVEGWKT